MSRNSKSEVGAAINSKINEVDKFLEDKDLVAHDGWSHRQSPDSWPLRRKYRESDERQNYDRNGDSDNTWMFLD